MKEQTLWEQLSRLKEENWYPMHMPGHKRNEALCPLGNPYGYDITEIDGFDNLHAPESILKQSMERTAALFGAQETRYLVGGSTAGILIGISACTKPGDTILVARNSHRAVYHAIEQMELKPVYLYPDSTALGFPKGIDGKMVEKALEAHPECRLVVITSPTYEGILSEIKEIAVAAHKRDIPLFVDEAHGAHLGLFSDPHPSSGQLGADLVVQSAHKTLPAFTQSALLHRNGTRVDVERLQHYFDLYQTSSPSYLLMAGLDAMTKLLCERGEELVLQYRRRLTHFYEEAEQLKNLAVFTGKAEGLTKDEGKLVLYAKDGMTGKQIYDILRRDYRIQPEMAAPNYALCMSSLADTEEGFTRLLVALGAMDKKEYGGKRSDFPLLSYEECAGEAVCTMKEALDSEKKTVPLTQSAGFVAADYAGVYPPGIPLLVPGEKITKKAQETLECCKAAGLTLFGVKEEGLRVLKGTRNGKDFCINGEKRNR